MDPGQLLILYPGIPRDFGKNPVETPGPQFGFDPG